MGVTAAWAVKEIFPHFEQSYRLTTYYSMASGCIYEAASIQA
jgi:hypothetical protein